MAGSQMIIRSVIFACILVSAVFCILATATNSWYVVESITELESGLWRSCALIQFLGSVGCSDTPINDSLQATRSFMILSCIGYLAAIVFIAVLHFKKTLKLKFLGILLLVIVVFEIIAMSVYTDKYIVLADLPLFAWGWSFGLGWAAPVITILPAVLCFIDQGYSEV